MLLALWLMVFSTSSQLLIVVPILPRIGEALAIGASLQGTLVTGYAVGLGVLALVAGPISDRIGRRPILLIGTGFMTVCLYLHGIADTYASLLAMRVLAGAAGGMLSGAAVSYVGDYFPYERRGWANGWVMSAIAAVQIVGIPLGTLLAELVDYRWSFLMFAFTMTGAFVLIWRGVPQPEVRLDDRRLSVRRVLADYARLLRWSPSRAAAATYFLMFLSIGLYMIHLPTWLEHSLGVSGGAIASLFLAGGVAHVFAVFSGSLSDRMGRKPLIVWSCVALAIVMMLTTYLVQDLWVACVFFALMMALIAVRISPVQSLLSALVPDDRRGTLMSLAMAFGYAGIGISGALSGLVYAHVGFLANAMLGAATITGMAVLVRWGLPEPGGDAYEVEPPPPYGAPEEGVAL